MPRPRQLSPPERVLIGQVALLRTVLGYCIKHVPANIEECIDEALDKTLEPTCSALASTLRGGGE